MTDFVNGANDPSPVLRVIAFGYYDGATDGVMDLGGTEYRFDLADESHNPDGCDERWYTLRPLPPGSVAQLVAVLSEYLEPRWPAWVPVWKFPTAAVQGEVERKVDAVLEQAGEPRWRVHTTDTVHFQAVTAESVRTVSRAV
jgi:hypothetical protein